MKSLNEIKNEFIKVASKKDLDKWLDSMAIEFKNEMIEEEDMDIMVSAIIEGDSAMVRAIKKHNKKVVTDLDVKNWLIDRLTKK